MPTKNLPVEVSAGRQKKKCVSAVLSQEFGVSVLSLRRRRFYICAGVQLYVIGSSIKNIRSSRPVVNRLFSDHPGTTQYRRKHLERIR